MGWIVMCCDGCPPCCQVPCHMTWTCEATHKLISEHMHLLPSFTGGATGKVVLLLLCSCWCAPVLLLLSSCFCVPVVAGTALELINTTRNKYGHHTTLMTSEYNTSEHSTYTHAVCRGWVPVTAPPSRRKSFASRTSKVTKCVSVLRVHLCAHACVYELLVC
jgi:hypothetical protein